MGYEGKSPSGNFRQKSESRIWTRYCGNGKNAYCYMATTREWRDMKDLYPEINWQKDKDYYNKYYIQGCGGDFHFTKSSKTCTRKKKNKGTGLWVPYDAKKSTVAQEDEWARKGYEFEYSNAAETKGKRYLRFTTEYCCEENYCNSSGAGMFSWRTYAYSAVCVAVAVALQIVLW